MSGSLVQGFLPRVWPRKLCPLPLPPPTLHPSTCRNLSSEVFCFMSQLLLSFFSPSFPGASQEHSPDILKLLAPHPRLKEHVESLATEGTSHNLPKLSQVKLHSPSSLVTLRLAVLWANMGSEPSLSYLIRFPRKKKWSRSWLRSLLEGYFLKMKLDFRRGPGVDDLLRSVFSSWSDPAERES